MRVLLATERRTELKVPARNMMDDVLISNCELASQDNGRVALDES
jgi:hypothetical protein